MQLQVLTAGMEVIDVKDRLTGERICISYEDFKPQLEMQSARYKAVNNVVYTHQGVAVAAEEPKVLSVSQPELKSADDSLSPADQWAMITKRIAEVGGYLRLSKEEKAVYQSLKDQFKK